MRVCIFVARPTALAKGVDADPGAEHGRPRALGALIAFAVIVFVGFAFVSDQNRQAQVEDDFDDINCERWGNCD